MRKRCLLLAILAALCCSFLPLSAQENPASGKGVTPATTPHSALDNPHSTRAVIIGISDYQDEAIPDLRFADRDAEAFALYLQSSAGGSLPAANIRLLTNKQATNAALAEALDWLVEQSREGDQAIIYFSGHGDVEAKTARQPGFLLCYDSPSKIYIAGAYPLFYLQLIIETLSSDKNVQTIVITDACRAGKLAGSAIGGTQATAANLAKQYANEIKILSCQPDEYSLEGEQWGGGRGAFSYHLIEGMIGLADKNSNGNVSLLELENYLETIVPVETDPQTQIPMTVGSKGTKVADVDAGVLAKLKDLKSRQLPTLAAIESKGFEEAFLAGVDTAIQEKYDAFIAALEHKNLLDGAAGQPSADDLYRELMQEESLASLHRFMTRRFATALQDDAQQAINAYLLTNPTELEKRWKGDKAYAQFPRYLGRAAELLGEQHYMHDYLLAKKYYFEGLNLRLLADQGNGAGSYREAIEKQEAALALEDRAAFFYNELGVLYTHLKQDNKAAEYFEMAIELAPQWGLPYVNYCIGLFYTGQYKKSIAYGEKALEYLPEFPKMYNFLAWIYANETDWRNKKNWERQGLELAEDVELHENSVHTTSQLKNRYRKSIELLESAKMIDTTYFYTYYNLGAAYWQTAEHKKAEAAILTALRLDSTFAYAYFYLGRLYLGMGETVKGKAALLKAIELSKTDWDKAVGYNSLQWAYQQEGDRKTAARLLQQAIELAPGLIFPYINLSSIHLGNKEYKLTENTLLKGLMVDKSSPLIFSYLVDYYNQVNRWDEVEYFGQKGIEIKPDNVKLLKELSWYYWKTRQFEKALEWQKKVIEAVPNEVSLYINAGQMAYLNKQKKQAKAYFDKAIEFGANSQVYADIARFCLVHGEYDWAENYAQLAQRMDSTWYQPYEILAWCYFIENRPDEAQKVLDQGIVLSEGYKAHLNATKALIYYFTGEGEKCKQYFQQAEAADPSNIYFKGLVFLGERLKEKDYAVVDSFFTAYNARTPTREALYLNALARAQLGHQEAAIEALKKSLESDVPFYGISYDRVSNTPELEPLRKTHAYQEMMRRHFPEKYDDLDTFEFTKPQPQYYPENCIILAKYYDSQGETERAKFLYEKAIELKPDTLSSALALQLAEVYLKQGKYDDAKAICPEEFEPDGVGEHLSTGQLYYQLGKPDKAETHFAAYVQKGSRINRAQQIAWFYHWHNECDLAEQYLRKALEINPSFHGPYYDLGWLHFTCGDVAKAIRAMDEGIQAFPAAFDLKGIKAMIIALSDPSGQPGKAFLALEKERPDMAQVITCLNLMQAKKYAEATAAYQILKKEINDWWAPRMLQFAYVRMLVAKGDLDAAMDEVEKGDTWIFSYPLLYGAAALAPLRETERFRAFVQRKFPEKTTH